MGEYATTTSFSELIPYFLQGNTLTSDSLGAAVLDKHITRAEAVVKSYAGARYDLSVLITGTTTTNVPPLLRTLTEDVASYYAVRGTYTKDGQIENRFLDDYKWAIDMLESIRDGKTKLTYTNSSLVPVVYSTRFLSSHEDYAQIMNLDSPTKWDLNDSEKDDISNTRD